MRVTVPGLLKFSALGLVVVAMFGLCQSAAKADEVLVTSLTNSYFTAATTPRARSGSSAGEFGAEVNCTLGSQLREGFGMNLDASDNQTCTLFTFKDLFCQSNPLPAQPGRREHCADGSLRLQIDLEANNHGQTEPVKEDSFAAQLTSIAEPATLILLGSGLCGIAALGRRRRKFSQVN